MILFPASPPPDQIKLHTCCHYLEAIIAVRRPSALPRVVIVLPIPMWDSA